MPLTLVVRVAYLLLLAVAWRAVPAAGQTLERPSLERPILIDLAPADSVVHPDQNSELVLRFRVPRGFRLGALDQSVRMPAPTHIEVLPSPCFQFGLPHFPDPLVRGVPVKLGTARVYEGEVRGILPFVVRSDCRSGEYTTTILLTYTPAVSAGQISTHIKEPYQVRIQVRKALQARPDPESPAPTLAAVPENFFVKEKPLSLPKPMSMIMRRLSEDGIAARMLHAIFVDPPNHGKHIQMVPHPFVADSDNEGTSLGAAMSFVNTTREGIMTGTVDMLVYHNQYAGTTGTLTAVSCPAAYHNYWLTAEVSEDRNRQFHFHTEDLTLGRNSRFGYELQVDLFQDPRFRFYGLGGATNENAETVYTHKELGGSLDFFWNAATHLRFTAGSRVRRVTLSHSVDDLRDKFPYTATTFAEVPGIQGGTVLGERLSLIYDRRNQEFHTSSGTYVHLTAELDHGVSDARPEPPAAYGRFTLETRHYRSTVDQRFTLLLRNTWTLTTGEDDIPFFDLPTLGGPATLRGFEPGRFYGKQAVFGSAELRMSAMHMVIAGFPMDLELAPFLDVGQVFQNEDFDGEFNFNPGLSLRLVNPPNIGMILNGAAGQDGIAFTGGVSLPF